jgi:ketosteroid isomerase-like protein
MMEGPSGAAERLLRALDAADADDARSVISTEAQGIDEVSRRWIRDSGELRDSVDELVATATDMRSKMHDVHEVRWDDTGVVTFWLEQAYTLEGRRLHVAAPTTYVFRREDGAWKLVLGHSIPLPLP